MIVVNIFSILSPCRNYIFAYHSSHMKIIFEMTASLRFFFLILVFVLILSSCVSLDNTSTIEKKILLSGEKHQEKLTEKERIDLIKERRNELDSIRK